ncbi:hypothetical protein SAMN02799630_02842 [Paenibacillus sp. UNCCL117]|uniref:hypothetical protein n=1 Tax=unclassified Paenibacillus TaxID=185978 RepID=UPI00088C1AA1|nr:MULTISPECIES: hypothetical protein [unclassified Paenibacillus]SDD28363.1 hypothetical protein SAMN04488602_107149 [Paenibacillus sp. cl123]SFW40923.1 hypothetical protein SAMN02799630_02842 [Paenibacillus sp. UNCCL117]
MIIRILKTFPHTRGDFIHSGTEVSARKSLTNDRAYQILEGVHIGAEIPDHQCYEVDQEVVHLQNKINKLSLELEEKRNRISQLSKKVTDYSFDLSEARRERDLLLQQIERSIDELPQPSDAEVKAGISKIFDEWDADRSSGRPMDDDLETRIIRFVRSVYFR